MSNKLSKKLKEYQRYLKVTSGIDSEVEEMITDAEALEKLLKELKKIVKAIGELQYRADDLLNDKA